MFKLKNKLWIKARVFLSFSILIIFIVNIFVFLLYFFVSDNIQKNINKSIINEFDTIKTFVDLQRSNIFSLPKHEIEKLNNLWFYFYIWNNDIKLQNKYKLWFAINSTNIIFRWDYSWYNIIIGKNINDFNNFKNSFKSIIILLNIFLIISIFILSYYITTISLTPLLKLSFFLNNYKNIPNQKPLKNNYANSEIWILTDSINNFIKQNNTINESQINFIQDVNHELKTPLMQIESNIELIENQPLENKIKKRIDSIKESTYNINEIISNLWFILRWEKTIINKQNINLYDYISNLIKNYSIILKEKNININLIKNYDLILNNNDYYLDRLFWNIISNAIFYNEWNNNIYISINKNNISIKDEWIWINKNDIQNIFTRFYRNKNSGLYYKKWNWLWLSIVKKICNLFWWKIDLKSEKWIWTNIIIYIK